MDGRHIIRFRHIIRYLFEFCMKRLNLSGHLRVLSQASPSARWSEEAPRTRPAWCNKPSLSKLHPIVLKLVKRSKGSLWPHSLGTTVPESWTEATCSSHVTWDQHNHVRDYRRHPRNILLKPGSAELGVRDQGSFPSSARNSVKILRPRVLCECKPHCPWFMIHSPLLPRAHHRASLTVRPSPVRWGHKHTWECRCEHLWKAPWWQAKIHHF